MRIPQLLGLAIVVAGLTGCSTYNKQSAGASGFYKSSNFAMATKELGLKAAAHKSGKDAVIWRLELAAALRAEGKYEESNKVFEEAEAMIAEFEEKAKVSVTKETGALFSNQANLPYTGRDYDKIMMSTYKALNYLSLGDKEKARPELIRAYQRQQEAVENNKKRIEKEQKEIEEAANNPDNKKTKDSADQARENPKFKGELDTNYAVMETIKPYADYVNPFTEYLNGVFFAHLGEGATDMERSRKSFERTLNLIGENKFVKADFDMMDERAKGGSAQAVSYVVFETGSAAYRDQIRIDVPFFIGNLGYIGAAFPVLKKDDNFMPFVTVSAGGVSENTVLVSDMDTVVGQQLKDELPTIITKTILASTAKAVASYAANKAAEQAGGSYAGLAMKLFTMAAQAALNIADTRSWQTLPKQYQVARVPTPKGAPIEVSAPGTGQKAQVTVEPDSVNLIFVKSVTSTSPIFVTHTRLK